MIQLQIEVIYTNVICKCPVMAFPPLSHKIICKCRKQKAHVEKFIKGLHVLVVIFWISFIQRCNCCTLFNDLPCCITPSSEMVGHNQYKGEVITWELLKGKHYRFGLAKLLISTVMAYPMFHFNSISNPQ